MTVKKTLGAYADCAKVMELAIDRGEIKIDFATYGAAINFRQRCYRLRQELLKADTPAPGQLPRSRYDELVITIPKKDEPEPNTLTFRSREKDGDDILSRIRDAEGNPIAIEEENLEEAAKAFRNSLGLE